MPIRVSATKQVESLIEDLRSASEVAREAAVARLTLVGARAVERLIAVATSGLEGTDARAAAWRALEGIGDARALEPALRTLTAGAVDAPIAIAAAAAARPFIGGPRGAAVVDQLTSVVLDRSRHDGVRLAALRALSDLDRKTIAPLLASLKGDSSAAIRTASAAVRAPGRDDDARTIVEAAERGLGDDPAALRAALQQRGGEVELAALLRVVERVREREGAEPPARQDAWRLVRAAAHQALAERGSRIALYDLRESLERASGPLPVEFFAALSAVGDATCLEVIADAHAAAADAWSRQHLADAFYAIVTRERLTARSPVLKRLAKKWNEGARGAGGAGRAGEAGRPGEDGRTAAKNPRNKARR